jgi:hypothetical protein
VEVDRVEAEFVGDATVDESDMADEMLHGPICPMHHQARCIADDDRSGKVGDLRRHSSSILEIDATGVAWGASPSTRPRTI